MRAGPARPGGSLQSPKPPGRSLMSVRGNAAPRGMTAHDRIRLTGSSCRIHKTAPEEALPAGADCGSPEISAKGPVSRILSCAVIPLGAALPRTLISDLPGGFNKCSSRLNASGRCAAPPDSWRTLPSLFGLAPCGVYPAPGVTAGAVRSYRTISPLPRR